MQCSSMVSCQPRIPYVGWVQAESSQIQPVQLIKQTVSIPVSESGSKYLPIEELIVCTRRSHEPTPVSLSQTVAAMAEDFP
jgi:hypothetical protein